MANPKSDAPASLWQPLRSSTFRNLLVADVVSDVGTFMQSVGAAWLMGSNFGEVGICQFKILSSKGILVFNPPQLSDR